MEIFIDELGGDGDGVFIIVAKKLHSTIALLTHVEAIHYFGRFGLLFNRCPSEERKAT